MLTRWLQGAIGDFNTVQSWLKAPLVPDASKRIQVAAIQQPVATLQVTSVQPSSQLEVPVKAPDSDTPRTQAELLVATTTGAPSTMATAKPFDSMPSVPVQPVAVTSKVVMDLATSSVGHGLLPVCDLRARCLRLGYA